MSHSRITSFGVDQKTVDDFLKELKASHQGSVDAFLEHRREFIEVGKKAIALHLIREETEDRLDGAGEDWYTYLIDRMTERTPFSDFGKNKVSFVTFNYDGSLEHYLFKTLRSRYGKSDEEVGAVLRNFRIIHVHGNLGYLPWQNQGAGNQRKYEPISTRDTVEIASKGIKIISEDLDSNSDFGEAWDVLSAARQIAIMGFGYHPVNMKRLHLPQTGGDVVVIGTCKGFTETERRRVLHRNEGLRLSPTGNGIMDFLRNEPAITLD
jgi:hypothetical protein